MTDKELIDIFEIGQKREKDDKPPTRKFRRRSRKNALKIPKTKTHSVIIPYKTTIPFVTA